MGVAGRDSLDSVNNFITSQGVDRFEHAYDDTGQVWSAFGVFSQPAFAFIDAEGNAEVVPRGLGEEGITERLEAILAP